MNNLSFLTMRQNRQIELPASKECVVMNSTHNMIVEKLAEPLSISGRNVVVRLESISANKVNTQDSSFLSWDASGEVLAVGPTVKHYQVGDKVFFPGDMIALSRTKGEHHILDERLLGKMSSLKNNSIGSADCVNSLTASEILFDHCTVSRVGKDKNKTLLVVGGEGHVGANLIELAKTKAELIVVATALRVQNKNWLKTLGVDHVVNHHSDLDNELAELGLENIDYIICLNSSEKYSSVQVE